jgi:hypothetical protein
VFSFIHSADSVELVAMIDRALSGGDLQGLVPVPFPVLVQVNVSGEDTKSGIEPKSLRDFLSAFQAFSRVAAAGLMTMAPWSDDPESSRPHFARLAALGREAAAAGLLPERFELSMGMTGDFEVAVEEGATLLRIVTALFA